MKLQIATAPSRMVVTSVDYEYADKEEVAHYIAQLEMIKNKLVKIWDSID